MIEPLGPRVAVRVLDDGRAQGVVIPPGASTGRPRRGVVIGVGPGFVLHDGETVALTLQMGDEVLLPETGGTEFNHDGERVVILDEPQVLCRLQDDQRIPVGS